MSKWGVPLPQFSSFNVDLGKAWKSVENSIDKAIGIPDDQLGAQSPSQTTQQSPSQVKQKPVDNNKSPLPTRTSSSTPTTPTTPTSKSHAKQPPQQQKTKPVGDDLSLEELLNGKGPIPSSSKPAPSISPLLRPSFSSSPSPSPSPSPSLSSSIPHSSTPALSSASSLAGTPSTLSPTPSSVATPSLPAPSTPDIPPCATTPTPAPTPTASQSSTAPTTEPLTMPDIHEDVHDPIQNTSSSKGQPSTSDSSTATHTTTTTLTTTSQQDATKISPPTMDTDEAHSSLQQSQPTSSIPDSTSLTQGEGERDRDDEDVKEERDEAVNEDVNDASIPTISIPSSSSSSTPPSSTISTIATISSDPQQSVLHSTSDSDSQESYLQPAPSQTTDNHNDTDSNNINIINTCDNTFNNTTNITNTLTPTPSPSFTTPPPSTSPSFNPPDPDTPSSSSLSSASASHSSSSAPPSLLLSPPVSSPLSMDPLLSPSISHSSSLPDKSPHHNHNDSYEEDDASTSHEYDHDPLGQDTHLAEDASSVTRSSSSSSLMELGSEATELELKSKIIELNGKISAIAIIEKEKDRQLEEKAKLLAIREKQLESAMERHSAMASELQNLNEEVMTLRHKSSSSSSSSSPNDLVESLKEEFSRRLGATEKKLQAVTKERDELKKGSSVGDQTKGVLKAKDDEINTLRTEGTNLSLKILNLESALKKYRATKKDDDASLLALREKLTQAETLLEKRNDRVKQLEFSEKKYLETITTMKDVSDMASRKLEKKEQEFAYAQKQIQELQNSLDKANKELLGAKRTTQEAGDKYLSEVEEAKRAVASEYQMQSNKQASEFQTRIQQQEAVIAELRASLSSATDQAGRKEDSLLREIHHLRESLDAAEKRNEEIMQSIPDSTRPLLRQIESLRSLLETKTQAADSVEKDLRARLADEEIRCASALEKERTSSSALNELTHRLSHLEAQYEEEHQLVAKLRMEVETSKLDEKKNKRTISELNAKLAAAEVQEERLNDELKQIEERHQRTFLSLKELEEALTKSREKEKEVREELNKLHRFGTSNGPYSTQRSSVDLTASTQSFGQASTGMTPNMNGMLSSTGIVSRDPSGSLPLVERLQAMLSQREGEISVIQSQLASLESARKDLQEELAAASTKNEALSTAAAELSALKAEAKELQQKFSTALQLVGEKEEQVMELKMDIQDLKEMYRTQISELIEQNENLKRKK